MSFRFHMKPVVAKPKPAVKPRADKAPSKGPPATKVAAPTEAKGSAASADEETPSTPVSTEVAEIAPQAEQPPVPVGRTRTVSYRSQDESASSADESRKSKVVSRLVKARIKPSIPGTKKTPGKTIQTDSAPPSAAKTIADVAEARVARQGVSLFRVQTPVQTRTGPDFKPSPHLVPAAPNSVPSHTELSSSEDEGVIDPYNPDHPLGHRENPEKCRGTKSPWIMKKFRSGVPTAMIDYLFYNPKGNPMVHDDDKVLEPENKVEENEEDVDDPEEENEPRVAAPQLKIGPDGKFILDDTSLVVETTAAREGRRALQTGLGASFTKRKSNRTTWTDEETLFFYKCLNSVGTDFAMMTRFFPHRTRHQIKLKFKLEEKRNPSLVDKALGANANYDVAELEKEYLDVSENAAKARAQKRKPRDPKPREKKSDQTKNNRKRSKKHRNDYYYEGGSASDEDSSSEDENDSNLRREMQLGMAEDAVSKKIPRNMNQQGPVRTDGATRFAFVDVVPYSGSMNTRVLNPNALSCSQVNQLISQRAERDQLRYGNSELAFLLNSPTIREKENEKKKSPIKSTAVRRIVLEESPEKGQFMPSEVPTSTLCNNVQAPVAVEVGELNETVTRPAVEQIKIMLNKRILENEPEKEGGKASEAGTAPVIKVDRRKSTNTILLEDEEPTVEEEVSAAEDSEEERDEMESIAHSFSKPTKSGRVPKLRDLKSASELTEPKPKKARKAPVKQPKKPRARSKSKDQPVLEHAPAEIPVQTKDGEIDMQSVLADVEPGSLVVIKTAIPNEPGKEMVQVFMVPPANQSGTTIAHNPDGSVSQMSIGGIDMPLVPGMKISPDSLVPVVAATSGSAVVHSVPSEITNVNAGTQS